ncbi:MAG: hypothetical protein HQK55_01125, partial [Deltaproteobacteria bacterium]|nr:hypothetical protein [Deltaproteobacteria bacterium]
MTEPSTFNRPLWLKLLVTISLVVIIIFAMAIWQNIKHSEKYFRRLIEVQQTHLAEAIEGGMHHNLSIGNNNVVREQFAQVRIKMPKTQAYVFDFDQKITFSTHTETVGKSVSLVTGHLKPEEALRTLLTSGRIPDNLLENFQDEEPQAAVLRPIFNEKRCAHCHGQSRKVLGGIMVITSADLYVDAVTSVRNTNITIGLI